MRSLFVWLAIGSFVASADAAEMVADSATPSVTPQDLYAHFNMRSIKSSYGQRLKYYCESYPQEFFTKAKVVGDNKLELEEGDDAWTFTIVAPNKIEVSSAITSGTYSSSAEYDVIYDDANHDWRASETFIDIPDDCKHFQPES